MRSFELVYRIGGEEFLLLLPGLSLAEAMEIAERIRYSVAEGRPADLDLTISAGAASAEGGHASYPELFRRADAALLQAKREGRNRVVAGPALPTPALLRAHRLEPDAGAAPLPHRP